MTTYFSQWMFLALIGVLAASFAVDFVSASLDGALLSIEANLESLK